MLKQAVFLVGGLGTRLKDRTRATPKPLLEVGGRRVLDYLLDEVSRHGFTDILLLAGHFGQQLVQAYDNRDWHGARIKVLCEAEPLGTGGALRFSLVHKIVKAFAVPVKELLFVAHINPDSQAFLHLHVEIY